MTEIRQVAVKEDPLFKFMFWKEQGVQEFGLEGKIPM